MTTGNMESFHGSLREELSDAELFHTLVEAKAKVDTWLNWYNRELPHHSLGYRTPSELGVEAVAQRADYHYCPEPPEGRPGNLNHGHVNPAIS